MNGGSATITSADGGPPLTVEIPPSGEQSANVPAGEYNVVYSPPTNHRLAPGQSPQHTVSIRVNETRTVTINLVATGTLRAVVNGLTGTPSNGGVATVQRTDAAAAPINLTLLASGSAASVVPIGTYTVTYAPPNGYAVSTANPVTGLGVALGATSSAIFSVSGPPGPPVGSGNVQVTVNGLTGASAGGQVSARLTNGSGNTYSASLPAPSGASSAGTLAALPPGSYNVTYSPPAGYRTVAGQVNPLVVSVAAGATANTTFNAEVAPPSSGSLVFASDWSSAVGTGQAAVFDGGVWDDSVDGGGPANRLEVVPAAGLDFPAGMANVLKVLHRNNDSEYWNVNIQNGWTLPPVGGSIYFRLYFRHNVGGASGGMLHTVQTGPPGNCPYTAEHQFDKASATEIDFYISNYGGSGSSQNAHDWVVRLSKETTYRIEEQYTRTATNSWKIDARIYDSSGALIRQASDFACTYHPNHTIASHTGTITSGNDCFRNKMIGNPGDGGGRGSTDAAHQHIYYGGFAVSHTDWCGPYQTGE